MEIKIDYYERDFYKFLDKIDFKNKMVLDVGCGGGDKTANLVERGGIVTGCDVADVRKKENNDKFNFKIIEKDKFSFPDNSFDIVINFDVIEHVEDDLKFVNEMHRELKPGGVAYVTTPNLVRFGRRVRALVTGKAPEFPLLLGADDVLGDCIHLREYTKDTLGSLFDSSLFNGAQVLYFWLGLYHPLTVRYRIMYPPKILDAFSQTLIVIARKHT